MKNTHVDGLMLGLILGVSMLVVGGDAVASTPVRVAVAPFAGDPNRASSIAESLAVRLSERDLERVIPPVDSIAEAIYEPQASKIRRWAFASAVDTIVVGRVVFEGRGVEKPPLVIETILRSGHSGAELSRHQVVVSRKADLDEGVARLAVEILDALGHREARPNNLDAAQKGSPTSDVAEGVSTGNGPESGAGGGGGALDGALSKSKFRSDAPIEIKADEAEIINREEGRKLIFQRNVWVRQDNVTLRSDRLEATYRKGESEPRELVAEGHVRIVQDGRRAKCDRAIYLREENRMTCSGRAELIQGCDMIRGASIEFDLVGEQARVQGAASIVILPKGASTTECETNREQL